MIIYKTTNLVNGKIYVGKDCDNNPFYLGSGKILRLAVKKYGKENFRKEVLELCDASNVNEREVFWIKKLDARNKAVGYNITVGGRGWVVGDMRHSEKTRQLLSEKGRARFVLPNERMKSSLRMRREKNPFFGRHHSLESKKKSADAHSILYAGEGNPFYGKHHTEEARRAIGKANAGHCPSVAARAKMAAAQLARTDVRPRVPEDVRRALSVLRRWEARMGLGCYSKEVKQDISRRFSGKGNPFFGKHHSAFDRWKISVIKKYHIKRVAVSDESNCFSFRLQEAA